jgi:D-alanyl-D-alanine carboxypeptidase
MDADRRPPEQSVPAQLTRCDALGLVAAVTVGSLATSTAHATAVAGTQEAPWAAELTAVIPTAMGSIPGVIVGVWQDGQPLYVRAFGLRDTATGEPMTPDLYMRIGSNTKAFTTTAILQLVDQGRIGLDDPIGKYV